MLFAGRQNPALHGQNLGRLNQRRLHITGNLCHGRYKQIAKAMTRQSTVSTKPMLEQFFHQGLGISQSHQAISQISRWNYTQFFPQPTGRATIIGHCDYCCNIGSHLFDATKQDGKPVPATYYGNSRPLAQHPLFINKVHQLL